MPQSQNVLLAVRTGRAWRHEAQSPGSVSARGMVKGNLSPESDINLLDAVRSTVTSEDWAESHLPGRRIPVITEGRANGQPLRGRYHAEVSVLAGVVIFGLGATFGSFFAEAGKDLYKWIRRRVAESVTETSATPHVMSLQSLLGLQVIEFIGYIGRTPTRVRIQYKQDHEMKVAIREFRATLPRIQSILTARTEHVEQLLLEYPKPGLRLRWSIHVVSRERSESLEAEILAAYAEAKRRIQQMPSLWEDESDD